MKAFAPNNVPRRISTRTLQPILGDEATRIAMHFVSMKWVDDLGRPTDDLRALVAAYDSERWKDVLLATIKEFYKFVPLPWEDLTTESLHAAFVQYTGRESRILISAETFFLALAHECGVNLTDRLWKRANRAHIEAKRPKDEEDAELEAISLKDEKDAEEKHDSAIKASSKTAKISSSLQKDHMTQIEYLSKLLAANGSEMTTEERNAVVTLIGYFGRTMHIA